MDGRGRARLGDGEEETSQSCQTALYSVKRFLSSRRAGPAPLVASRRKRTRQAKDHKVQRTRRKTKEDKKEKSLDWVGSRRPSLDCYFSRNGMPFTTHPTCMSSVVQLINFRWIYATGANSFVLQVDPPEWLEKKALWNK